MSVSVEALAPPVTGRRVPPFRGGHGGVAAGSGNPLRGVGASSGGSVGRLTPVRRGLDASHSWSPSPTSVVSGNRGRGGRDDLGGCSDATDDDADDEDNDCVHGGRGRGMRPAHHGGDSAPARYPANGHHVASSLSSLPHADRGVQVTAGQAGQCAPVAGDPGGEDSGGWGLAAKETAVGDAVAAPTAKTSRWLPPVAPGAQAPSLARAAGPELFAYARVPAEPVRNGGDTPASGRVGATTGASSAGLLRGADLGVGAVGDTPPLRGTQVDRHVLAERSPLVTYPSAPEVMVVASPGAGNTKQPQGAARFLSAVASRVQVMAEHGSAVTAKRTRMGGALRRILIGVAVIFLLFSFAYVVRLHATTIRRTCRRLLLIYIHILHVRPLVSRAISAGVIFLSADIIAQRLASSTAPFDLVRLIRYSSYGLVVMGPFLYLWYSAMHLYGPDDTLVGAAQKALFEQVTLEPLCISGYMVWDGAARRRPMAEVRGRLRTQFWGLLMKNAVFWVPANFSNYAAGTPDLRVLYANLCSLFWNVYFSAFVNSLPNPTAAGAGSSSSGLGKARRTSSPPADESCGV